MKKLASCISHKKKKSIEEEMDFTKTTFRVYEILQPSETLVCKEKYDQIKLELPGFNKEDIRVKFNNGTTLEISGERLVGNKKWTSFKKDYLTPENCVSDEIRANFDDGVLQITMPKKIVTNDNISAEMVDGDFHEEEEKKKIFSADTAAATVEMLADNISQEENKEAASSTISTITNMSADDSMSVTDEMEKDAEHLQNEGKDYVDFVKEKTKESEIEDAVNQSGFAEDAIGVKELDADDLTDEYAGDQIELVLNMFAAGFVILMLVASAT